MSFDLNQIYNSLLGRDVGVEGNTYWTDQYNKAILGGKSTAEAISGIKGAIKASPEDQQPHAQHTQAAFASIANGQGVIDGTVPSYSDMYNPDGTPNPNWTNSEDWYKAKTQELYDQMQAGGGSTTTGGMTDAQYNSLMGGFGDLTTTLGDLKSAYEQSQKDMMAMWNNANWGGGGGGYNQGGQTVSGVKTQNELPGWKPKTGGSSGFFGRGGNRFGLSTSSLNTA